MRDIENRLKDLFRKMQSKSEFQESFQIFEKEFTVVIYKMVFGMVRNDRDTKIITGNIISKIFVINKEKLPKYRELSWTYALVKNETIKFLKKRNDNFDIETIYVIKDYEKLAIQNQYNKIIKNKVLDIQELLTLKIISGLSYKNISKILNKSVIRLRYEISIAITGNIYNYFILMKIFKKNDKENDKEKDKDKNKIF